ncbi:helix-turn-helix transcriptional regulator, partial [Nonomuraea sp. NPDC055795]
RRGSRGRCRSLWRSGGRTPRPGTWRRRFAQLVGQPPLTYLTWWRLGAAARMLRDKDAALSEIATAVGYSSEYAFSNAFKRQYGMAPGKYRRLGCPLPGR